MDVAKKKLYSKDPTCASLHIFHQNLANSDLETYGTPTTGGLSIKKFMTYTRYDGRNNLIEHTKI